jgi:formylglycine-generating enzyme required for sulfatase activity
MRNLGVIASLAFALLAFGIWQVGWATPERACIHCDEMIAIEAASFQIGSTTQNASTYVDELPQRPITISEPFAMGRHQVTRGQFSAFVTATGHQMEAGCWTLTDEGWQHAPNADWQSPGFSQTDEHPVVCVSHEDALAYIDWASEVDDRRYSLPSEAQWHLASTATQATPFWGTRYDICDFGNVPDLTSKNKVAKVGEPCDDGTLYTAAVGSFKPNPNGLFDMIGNVWEWTADCWQDNYDALPQNGSAFIHPKCEEHALRGHSWTDAPGAVTLRTRYSLPSDARQSFVGFRIASD